MFEVCETLKAFGMLAMSGVFTKGKKEWNYYESDYDKRSYNNTSYLTDILLTISHGSIFCKKSKQNLYKSDQAIAILSV